MILIRCYYLVSPSLHFYGMIILVKKRVYAEEWHGCHSKKENICGTREISIQGEGDGTACAVVDQRATLKRSFDVSFSPPSAHPSDHKKLYMTLPLSDVRRPTWG